MLSPPPSDPPISQFPLVFSSHQTGWGEEQKQWLFKELAESKADWKVVLGHHAIYSAGAPKWRKCGSGNYEDPEDSTFHSGPIRHPKGDGFVFFPERLARGFIKWGCPGYLVEPADSLSELCSDTQPVNEFLQSCSYSYLEEKNSYIKASFSSTTHVLRLPTSHHVWRPNEFSGFAWCQMEACMVLLKSCCVTWEQEDKKACDAWWV